MAEEVITPEMISEELFANDMFANSKTRLCNDINAAWNDPVIRAALKADLIRREEASPPSYCIKIESDEGEISVATCTFTKDVDLWDRRESAEKHATDMQPHFYGKWTAEHWKGKVE